MIRAPDSLIDRRLRLKFSARKLNVNECHEHIELRVDRSLNKSRLWVQSHRQRHQHPPLPVVIEKSFADNTYCTPRISSFKVSFERWFLVDFDNDGSTQERLGNLLRMPSARRISAFTWHLSSVAVAAGSAAARDSGSVVFIR